MHVKLRLPRISYPLSREIDSEWLSPTIYGLGSLGFIFLLVLNIALTAYETIIVTKDDFNVTQTHWYSKFNPHKTKPGTLCASYNLTVGEEISTTNNIFQYTLLGINGSQPALPYSGTPLDNCDIIMASVDVDFTAGQMVDIIAYVGCTSHALPIVVKTLYSSSNFGYSATSLDVDTVRNFFSGVGPSTEGGTQAGSPYDWIHYSLEKSADTIRVPFQDGVAVAATVAPLKMSINVIPNCTPDPSLARFKSAYCQNNDQVPITWIYDWNQGFLDNAYGAQLPLGAPNQTVAGFNWVSIGASYDNSTINWSDYYLGRVNDFVQLFASALRLDWGIIHPNNPFLNISYMNTTIQGSQLRDQIVAKSGPDPAKTYGMGAFSPDKSAYINAQYLCRFTFGTTWGRALISVTVATFSLFSTGWGVLMFVITFLAKKSPEAEYCAGHSAYIEVSQRPLSAALGEEGRQGFFTPLPYGTPLPYTDEKKTDQKTTDQKKTVEQPNGT